MKVILRFFKCMESMARDMRHPYIPSTTVLGDIVIRSIMYIPGIDSEQPILQPLTVRVCPNDTVTYTCRDTNMTEIDWYHTLPSTYSILFTHIRGFI